MTRKRESTLSFRNGSRFGKGNNANHQTAARQVNPPDVWHAAVGYRWCCGVLVSCLCVLFTCTSRRVQLVARCFVDRHLRCLGDSHSRTHQRDPLPARTSFLCSGFRQLHPGICARSVGGRPLGNSPQRKRDFLRTVGLGSDCQFGGRAISRTHGGGEEGRCLSSCPCAKLFLTSSRRALRSPSAC